MLTTIEVLKTQQKNSQQYKLQYTIEMNRPQQVATRQLTYEVVQLAPQRSYCSSIPISATVELFLWHRSALLHCQCYSSGDKQY